VHTYRWGLYDPSQHWEENTLPPRGNLRGNFPRYPTNFPPLLVWTNRLIRSSLTHAIQTPTLHIFFLPDDSSRVSPPPPPAAQTCDVPRPRSFRRTPSPSGRSRPTPFSFMKAIAFFLSKRTSVEVDPTPPSLHISGIYEPWISF